MPRNVTPFQPARILLVKGDEGTVSVSLDYTIPCLYPIPALSGKHLSLHRDAEQALEQGADFSGQRLRRRSA